jgi:putative transposase
MMTSITKGAVNRLRRGRVSQTGQIYLVTTVTRDRQPVFADLTAARTLIRTLQTESATGSCSTLAFVVMPDHLHWLLQLHHERLPIVVGRIKSLVARRLGGRIWQAGFHDRAVRDEEDLYSIARYVVANPLRAGLVEHVGFYPHWDAVWLE